MPVQEALEMAGRMATLLGRRPDLLVVNGLYPPVAGRHPVPDSALTRLWHMRRALNDRELARLNAAWQGPRVDLPFLPMDRGSALPLALAPILRDAMAGVEVMA
jgi:hypothetical protein